jgi:hypothetical protein
MKVVLSLSSCDGWDDAKAKYEVSMEFLRSYRVQSLFAKSLRYTRFAHAKMLLILDATATTHSQQPASANFTIFTTTTTS